ncbi:hypothetical protein [Flexivirga caeni]|nr:hypothetical protein [Flexivirga caeni]
MTVDVELGDATLDELFAALTAGGIGVHARNGIGDLYRRLVGKTTR